MKDVERVEMDTVLEREGLSWVPTKGAMVRYGIYWAKATGKVRVRRGRVMVQLAGFGWVNLRGLSPSEYEPWP